jgi:hypothetical protein
MSGIRTHDPGFRASEDSACLRPLGYRDRQLIYYIYIILRRTVFEEFYQLKFEICSFGQVLNLNSLYKF